MPKEIEMFFRGDEAGINVEGWLTKDRDRGWLTIHKDKQCQICKENKNVFEIDTSGHEYGSIFYCLDCLNVLMMRYKKELNNE